MSYLVTLRIKTLADLATLFQAVDKFAEMIETKEEVEEFEDRVQKKKKKSFYHRKPRVMGQSALDIITGNLPASRDKLQRLLIEKGFNGNSLSPALSTLNKAGKIRFDNEMVHNK